MAGIDRWLHYTVTTIDRFLCIMYVQTYVSSNALKSKLPLVHFTDTAALGNSANNLSKYVYKPVKRKLLQ